MRRIFGIVFCFLMCIFCFACSNNKAEDRSVKLVTSFYPIYIAVLNLTDGISDVEVENMTQNNFGCLHDFQVQASDIKKIEESSALIVNGAGMELFLDKIKESNPNIKIIDSSIDVDVVNSLHEHDEVDQDDDDEGELNSHIWMSVSNYIKQVENIRDGLISIDSKNEQKYRENADLYIEKLEKLRNKIKEEVSMLEKKDIVTFHDTFYYFADEFGLNIAGVISRGHESSPTAQDIANTMDLIKNGDAKAIFSEPGSSEDVIDLVSKETGIKVYTLDPVSAGEISKDAYINAMEKNLEVLKEALG